MVREEIEKALKKAVKRSFKLKLKKIKIERPSQKEFGDYSSNIALVLGKRLKKNPQEVAEKIKSRIKTNLFEVEIINSFLNFKLSQNYLQKQVKKILKKKSKFSSFKISGKKKINLEFISANPTGPLTLGNSRGGFWGDVLANILKKVGFKVTKEYYINNVGNQVEKLYRGEYPNRDINKLRKEVESKEELVGKIMEKIIKPIIGRMGIDFDVWFSEKALYQKGEIEKVLNYLKQKGLVFREEGALWFKSSQFGDDKDRVLIKKNGEKTYFLSDIAYLKNKFKRDFNKLIVLLGADHYGYVGRMKAAVEALGYNKEQLDFIIIQFVAVIREGKKLKLSKREGTYYGINNLIRDLGSDVVRFFFIKKSADRHLLFDYDLAKEESEKNPVYYIQYAYARICSLLKKADCKKSNFKRKLLNHPSELDLIKKFLQLPEIIKDIAEDYQVQRLPNYAQELAASFHKFYDDCRVIGEGEKTKSRLALVQAVKIVLKETLDLMGIFAPEHMFNNSYFFLRHGETPFQSKKEKVIYPWPEPEPIHLTEKGRKKVEKAGEELRNKGIDLIFSSDITRTRETADIISGKLGVEAKFDKRLREIDSGVFRGGLIKKYYDFLGKDKINKKPPRGESKKECQKRLFDFLKEIDNKYQGKKILIISHADPLWLLRGAMMNLSDKELLKKEKEFHPNPAEWLKVN